MTVKQIKEELDAQGIGYDSKARKDELLALLYPLKYVVVHDFKDLNDGGVIYIKGDPYPREENKHVSQDRIDELLSNKNKIGKQLIREQE